MDGVCVRARRRVCAGAHATDAEVTPSGYADLVAVCRASSAPVLARDWQLHPLQARARRLWLAERVPDISMCSPHGTADRNSRSH